MDFNPTRSLISLIFRLFTHINVHGWDHVPTGGSYIIISNHLGRLDAALVYYLLDRQDVIMMVAEKYRSNPLFRYAVRHLNAMWVDRFHADLGAMRQAMKRLKNGEILAMAPEGTRSKSGTLLEGRAGASYLAAKTGAPIVPVALVGTEDRKVLANLRRLRRSPIDVYIGPAFTLPPLTPGDREAQLQAYTDEMMCRIAALLPPSYRGVYADHPRLHELLGAVS